MADLHVVSLSYALRPNKDVSYSSPPPVEFETNEASVRLDDGTLTCEMKTHFSGADEARRAVEPSIRAWEVDADLRWGRDALRFIFDGANAIDRTPAPPGAIHGVALASGVATVSATATASAHVTRAQYPAPPPATFP